MPFLAVVYIPDDHTADSIIERHSMQTTEGRIVGLYELPPKEDTTCRGTCTTRGNAPRWTRHEGGYMICVACGMQNRDVRKRLVGAFLDYLGINLLRRAKTPRMFQNPIGYGSE